MSDVWIELGTESLISVSDLVYVGRDDNKLIILTKQGQRQVLVCDDTATVLGHYRFIRSHLGFSPLAAVP